MVVGNALSRGSPVIEAMLDRGMAYTSGPQWLAEQVLRGKPRAGGGRHARQDHDREHAGVDPGARRARAGIPDRRRAEQFRFDGAPGRRRRCFVIEADEYDTAFFDKRAKFVHYRPRTAILNNLEYDHADIYPDVASIRRQFNQLLRTVPARGTAHRRTATMPSSRPRCAAGCWTPRETFSLSDGDARLERRARAGLGVAASSRCCAQRRAVARGARGRSSASTTS